jgi:NAD(P)-dependent dehydrogenase (short-subunit alcohol dehydrogenase family)
MMVPMATMYTLVANLAASVLRPLNLFPRANPKPLPLQTTTSTLNKKVAIVTGSNTGIGLETARALADSGWDVILACRSHDKALEAAAEINGGPGKALVVATLDLSSISSIKEFAKTVREKYSKVNVLINNAGRNTSGPSEHGLDGKEQLDLCFSTNFLGHFVLVHQLLDVLEGGRIINVSSVMHHFCINLEETEDYWKRVATYGKEPDNTYAASKLAALLFSLELNQRYRSSRNIRSLTVNPGAVNSDIWRDFPLWVRYIFGFFYLDSRQGCYTSLAAALCYFDESVEYLQPYWLPASFPMYEMMGPFIGYRPTKPRLPHDGGSKSAQCLWKASEKLTGCVYPEN